MSTVYIQMVIMLNMSKVYIPMVAMPWKMTWKMVTKALKYDLEDGN